MVYRNRRRLIVVALVVVGLFTVSSAFRAFNHGRRFRERVDEPIQSWMNVPYIARAYRVPPPLVARAIGLSPEQRDRRPLREIAQAQGRVPEELIAEIMAAIEQERVPPRPPDADTAPRPPQPRQP
jgi:FtsZ-interacting cell division protein ZipA